MLKKGSEREGDEPEARQGALANQAVSSLTISTRAQIIGAIVLAKSKIQRLAKSEKNLDEAYAFTSIDSFLEHVNPICVASGLVVLMDEVAVADGGSGARPGQGQWLRITYEITLAHVSGETLGPFRRHVDVLRSGPQAFGAAQSYVLKQFLRAQFQIATGELDDPDFGANGPEGARATDRGEARTPRPKKVDLDGSSVDAGVLRGCAQRIVEATSGKDLLNILAGLADDLIAHPMLKAARLQALTRIVSSAQSVAALEKLEHHFAEDWADVSDEAVHRRTELELIELRAEEDASARLIKGSRIPCEVASSAVPMAKLEPDSGENASVLQEPDALEFGDIPYHEAAA